MTCGIEPNDANRSAQHDAIANWLETYSRALADLYVGAYSMMYQVEIRGRIRLIGHAVREIRNRLPDVVAGYKGGQYLEYKARLDEIAVGWQQAKLPLGAITSLEEGQITAIALPIDKVAEIGSLIKDHLDTRESGRERARRLFEACDPHLPAGETTVIPSVDRWVTATDWFMRLTHEPAVPTEQPDRRELRAHFELFEDALYGLSAPYFETLGPLDEILESANRG